jgi:hypothetical protein
LLLVLFIHRLSNIIHDLFGIIIATKIAQRIHHD